jgi:hypothetical protein
MMSDERSRVKKEQDCVDFCRITLPNRERINLTLLRQLADEVWSGGGDDIVKLLDIAVSDKPFPI